MLGGVQTQWQEKQANLWEFHDFLNSLVIKCDLISVLGCTDTGLTVGVMEVGQIITTKPIHSRVCSQLDRV